MLAFTVIGILAVLGSPAIWKVMRKSSDGSGRSGGDIEEPIDDGLNQPIPVPVEEKKNQDSR
jgi:hypothetical protein